MSEFHRMVTYLYLYEGNQKTRNVGYAKIEKRDAHCRVEIHMKNTGIVEQDIPVYFYTRNNSGFPGIPLGSIELNRGAGEYKGLLDSKHIADSEYDIKSIKGLFCPVSGQKMIVSQWDDDAFDREAFFSVAEPAPARELPSVETSAAEDSAGNDSAAEAVPETSSASEDSTAVETSPPPDGTTSVPENLKAAEAAPDLSYESLERTFGQSSDFAVPESQSPRWNFIMKNFPPTSPFALADSFDWVQLEVKDLKLMPKAYWHLNNNSFLLHGFFNYHHLILGKEKDTQPNQWILGVPGVFQNPERVMAALFGFPEFRSTSESNTKTGQFGYWLRPLT